MTTPTPIACSLTDAEYRTRLADFSRLARDARPIEGGVRSTFDTTARAELEALVAAEAECCPFLTLRLQAAGDHLVLEVTGPDAAAPIIAELLAG